MILDKYTMYAYKLAHNGTAEVVDLGAAGKAKPYNMKGFIVGHSLTGVTAVVFKDGATSSPTTTKITLALSHTELNAGVVTFDIPQDCKRYTTISLTGASGGTWSAGLVMDGVGIAT